MGSSTSKVGRATPVAARRYPVRDQNRGPANLSQTKQHAKLPSGSGKKEHAIIADGSDPDFSHGDFSRRLQQMGVVQPNPTFSPSSTAKTHMRQELSDTPKYALSSHNATLSVLEAREFLQQQADDDTAKVGQTRSHGRRFVDMRTLIDSLRLRDQGVPYTAIEERLKLQPGTLGRLGRRGILAHLSKAL
ncbi:hypothetical protein VFPPC_13002 [Pochonia chlamydosporia 170]|uniref:Helix-turn-helix domain-containing protein n=1 Tax=Pochonia chlamydosporia 170 TaxID=1380566 RepID=A0A179G6D2_METCM|nr:hypothetical protein VFPPC_13002 [Pochonia chlamydosporia 170]OAQ73394.1 hypothetical protein VFPPC_13002 [Pochonia chlamydosporia 170]